MSKLFDEQLFRAKLPPEMLAEKRFVRYFLQPKPDGGTAKIPLGNHSDPSTWSTFDECVAKLEPGKEQGIGYCFLGGDVHGLDIDHCRNPKTGIICNEAMMLLSRFPSWAEYSVSGQGIHVFFKGNVRGKQLTETCLQYWNPKNSPRFFALTCEMVGEAFTKLKDIGSDFNFVFSLARHISARIREELKSVDYDQWAKLPAERDPVEEQTKEKPKHKTRKLHKDFDLEDFLKFYSLPIDNVTNNDLGKCYRLTSCPIKGEPHVGQNSTSTNFILSNDGGLGFHCQSTGCVEYSVAQVIEKLAQDHEPYPKPIYVAEKKQPQRRRGMKGVLASTIEPEHTVWLWPGYLVANQLNHFGGASGQGKSPVTRDLISRLSVGREWPDGAVNEAGPQTTIVLASEDDWETVIIPSLMGNSANRDRVVKAVSTYTPEDGQPIDVSTKLDEDIDLLKDLIKECKASVVIIDPITNYLGRKNMNKEEEMRSILMPLAEIAQALNVCVITVGHLNKRDEKASVLERFMGAAAFGGVARQSFVFGPDPNDDDKFTHIMGPARASSSPALKYKTISSPIEFDGKTSSTIQVQWLGPVEHVDMDEVVSAPKRSEKTQAKEVQTLLKTLLRDGAKPTKVIEAALKEAGIDCENWQRPARRVAESRQIKGQGKSAGWEWFLLTPEQAEFDVTHAPKKEAASVNQQREVRLTA